MSDKFVFKGQTSFINEPKNTIIQNFQNTYISGNEPEKDKINTEVMKLIELILISKDLPNESKEETTQALHSIAEQVKEEKGNKLTIKGTLQAVQEVVSKAADIAIPAMPIVTTVFKLLGIS